MLSITGTAVMMRLCVVCVTGVGRPEDSRHVVDVDDAAQQSQFARLAQVLHVQHQLVEQLQ